MNEKHVTVRGRIKMDGTGRSRYANLEVVDFALGKQPLSSFLLSLLLGPSGGGLLQWTVPGTVEGLQVGDGRLVIATRPPG